MLVLFIVITLAMLVPALSDAQEVPQEPVYIRLTEAELKEEKLEEFRHYQEKVRQAKQRDKDRLEHLARLDQEAKEKQNLWEQRMEEIRLSRTQRGPASVEAYENYQADKIEKREERRRREINRRRFVKEKRREIASKDYLEQVKLNEKIESLKSQLESD